MRKLAIEDVKVIDLVPDPDNSRPHSRRQRRLLAKLILEYGSLVPFLTDPIDLELINGKLPRKPARRGGRA